MKILFVANPDADGTEETQRMIKSLYNDVEILMAFSKERAIDIAMIDGPFGVFIIDVDFKEINPEELCQDLMEMTGEKPLLFIGNEAMIKDRVPQEIYASSEQNNTLKKPLIRDDIKAILDDVLNFAKKEESAQSVQEVQKDDFIPMKIKNFYLLSEFNYDIYLEITATRFMKIIAANQKYNQSTLHAYAKKNVRYLYIKKDDQLHYLEDESAKCLKALDRSHGHDPDIHIVILRSINILHQYINALGIVPTVVKLIDKTILEIHELCQTRVKFARIVEDYPVHFEGIASKSLLSAYMGISIANKLEWNSFTSHGRIALAAILMDLALEDDELSKVNGLNDFRLKMLSEEQLESFLKHSLKAGEVARALSNYPDVDFLIENHHETPNRKGFPNKIGHIKLTTMSSVFNIAQYIAAEVDGIKFTTADIQKIIRSMGRNYNMGTFKECLKHAKDVLRTSRPLNKVEKDQEVDLDMLDLNEMEDDIDWKKSG